jgi:hypothetical protein
MHKFLSGAVALAVISTFSAIASAADSYDTAYSSCSEKADKAGSAYEETFTSCMKEKGFTENEDGEGDSPYSAAGSSAPQEASAKVEKTKKK